MTKKQEEIQKKIQEFHEHHNRKMTRRDLLSSGIIQFTAALTLPTIFDVLAKQNVAQAADLVCRAAATSTLCPIITVNLAGGAAMAANFVPQDQGLQPLADYTKMGLGLGSRLTLVRDFANSAPFYNNSQFLAGVKTAAPATTLANASFVGVCVRSQDDTSNNKFDITGLVSKAGLAGKILPNLGRANTATGNNTMPAAVNPPAPLVVNSYNDIAGALGVSGSLAAFSADQRTKLFQTIQNLSASQAQKLTNYNDGATLSQLIQCGTSDNTKLASGGSGTTTDPVSNAQLAQVWNITANSSKTSQDYVFAAMVFNGINGNAGTINLTIGGYDYHNNTRATGDQKDNDAGVTVGRILQSLAVMNTKAFIIVVSDGSVTSSESQDPGAPWTSDRGTAGAAYMIAYDPAGPHATKSFQLGHFTDGQVADDQFLTGGVVELAAEAMFANYLAFNGQVGSIEQYLPRVFSTTDLDQILMFS